MTADRGAAPFLMVLAAAVAWCGVLLQLYLSLRRSLANGRTVIQGLIVYLGYFTILTNLLVAAGLTLPLVAPASAPPLRPSSTQTSCSNRCQRYS